MTNETAAFSRSALTFLSRFSSLLLVVASIGLGCSSTDPNESGAGGVGGATTGGAGMGGPTAGSGGTFVGGGGSGGGPVCARSPSELPFGCAATYDQQVSAFCGNAIETSIAKAGQCGSGWAWSCGGLSSRTCFFDSQKNLIRGRYCDDIATPYCAGCSCDPPNCVDSRALSTDVAPTCNVGQLPPVSGAGGATGS
jgi:hypothetical protein